MSNPVVFPRQTVHDQLFLDAASRLAGAVAIATWHEESPGGLLVRSVSLLSTRPARVLFGVAKDSPAHQALLGADSLALNLLSEADEAEAERFDGPLAAQTQFPPDRWRLQPDHPPRFLASAVHLAGIVDHRIDAGSHSLFVLRVETAEINDQAPLVSFGHGFCRLAQAGFNAGRDGAPRAASA